METLEEKLKSKLIGVRTDMEQQLFNQWRVAKTLEEREELYAIYKGIGKLTSFFNKSINGDNNDG